MEEFIGKVYEVTGTHIHRGKTVKVLEILHPKGCACAGLLVEPLLRTSRRNGLKFMVFDTTELKPI